MLGISWFEFIVRGFAEEFLFVLAIHAFTNTGINLKRYLLSGTIFWISVSAVRTLPINYGVHTILDLIILTVLARYINKINTIKAMRAGFLIVITELVFEGINMFILQFILKIDLDVIMNDPILKTFYGLPSIILLGIFVISYYIWLAKRNKLNYN